MSIPNLINLNTRFSQSVITTAFTYSNDLLVNNTNSYATYKVLNVTALNSTDANANVVLEIYTSNALNFATVAKSTLGRNSISFLNAEVPLYLNSGEFIRARSSANNTIKFIVTYEILSEIKDIPYFIQQSLSTDPRPAYTFEALIVGGGGGGSGHYFDGSSGGGGGAGGLIYAFNVPVPTKTVLSVIVGGGGAGGINGTGSRGASSNVFVSGLNIIADGGGAGGTAYNNNLRSGGSGGGAAANINQPLVSGTNLSNNLVLLNGIILGYGNDGGGATSGTAGATGAGGGGGAGGAGQASPGALTNSGCNGRGGAGGIGRTYDITGSSILYAAGGGGGAEGTAGAGGSGVGGAGGSACTSSQGQNALAFRGSGGGGRGGSVSTNGNGGNGSSGVVIIRYPGTTQRATGGNVFTFGGNTIHYFDSSGFLRFN